MLRTKKERGNFILQFSKSSAQVWEELLTVLIFVATNGIFIITPMAGHIKTDLARQMWWPLFTDCVNIRGNNGITPMTGLTNTCQTNVVATIY
jgi:hypothetical protein